MKHCMEKDLPPAGPMVMVYLKAPPAVKDPKKFVSELCVPMAVPPPAKPKKDGEFTLKGTKPMKVLAMFGVGDYKTKTPELMQKLTEEAKKKKAKAAGPMMQVGYTDPKEYPPEQCVSEMQLPIK
jgi:effector-binding domain-containing protein